MGWAVGYDQDNDRHIGYGVPATCDHPGCGAIIDRGLGYACGGGVVGEVDNCGLFFCGDHLELTPPPSDEWLCERCGNDKPPFEPTPDTAEWVWHVATDPSWAEFRREYPGWVQARRATTGAR